MGVPKSSEAKAQRDAAAADLMKRYQDGERRAFDGLVGLLGPPVYRFFLHGFRDQPTADDLYQETWLKVHQARHTHRPGEPVLPWLFGVARHVAADHRRQSARHRRRVEAVKQVADATGGGTRTDATASRSEAAEILVLAMEGLPENQREALFLLKVEGMSVQEAAKIAGTTPGALKVRAHRAYARMRARVTELESE